MCLCCFTAHCWVIFNRYETDICSLIDRARVQYEITQHPKLASQLPAPLAEILHIALASHRDALGLQQDNADILFNTAQVLTSLAEVNTEGKHPSESHVQEALKYLHEALELFQRCLVLQELQFTEFQQQKGMPQSDDLEGAQQQQQESEESNNSSAPAESEVWAAVVQPVTKNTLIDTAVAQLETLATLCGLLTFDTGSSLAWIEECSSGLLREKIAGYVEGTDRKNEVAIARAKFICTLAEITYRSGRIDLETYRNEITSAFGEGVDISQDPSGLCSHAEALVAFNNSVADSQLFDADVLASLVDMRWQALTLALDRLTAASKLPHADNLPKIHIARGDAEMYRLRLGQSPFLHIVAKNNSKTLLKNAETYYRGAAAIAQRDGWAEERLEGGAKEAIAKGLSDLSKMEAFAIESKQDLLRVAGEMVEDGQVAADDMHRLMLQSEPDEIVF